ncbi:MAG: type III-B CRISPR-associated protein Cas10/Cmr2 [Firmicutes bacterium]|nr:type III-B CRISPR-associated protein Cas10/Cmr2 [Bacillota bacterium]
MAQASQLGTLPNRFRIDGPGDGPDAAKILVEAAEAAAKGLQETWERLATATWGYLRDLGAPDWESEKLHRQWQGQVQRQWEITWVVSQDPAAMDQRKNWRVFPATVEPGVRCSVCGERSALSPDGGARHGEVRAFWTQVARRVNRAGYGQQIRDEDRLCAVCTIKRIYPLLTEVLGHGLKPQTHYASTVTIAATEWVKGIIAMARDQAGAERGAGEGTGIAQLREPGAGAVSSGRQNAGEVRSAKVKAAWDRLMDLAAQAGVQCPDGTPEEDRPFEYDGYLYYLDELRDKARGSGPADSDDVLPLKNDSLRPELLRALRALKEAVGDGPRPYYALLAMDGDHMGAILRQVTDPALVSQALARFSAKARQTVARYDGRPIYLGGDDVLAFFPPKNALRAARDLRHDYLESFAAVGISHGDGLGAAPGRATQGPAYRLESGPSISAGIVFADMREPLRDVIVSAHRVLDEIAKEKAGRDAFALLLLKHSGSSAVLAKKWQESLDHGVTDWVEELYALAQDIRPDEISTGLLYSLQKLLDVFAPGGYLAEDSESGDAAGPDSGAPGGRTAGAGDPRTRAQIVRLIAAEYLRNRLLAWPEDTSKQDQREQALSRARRLLAVATVPGGHPLRISLDGPVIARFLSGKGGKGEA